MLDLDDFDGDDDVVDAVRELTGGRGPDAVIDAVGMEAHGSPAAKLRAQGRRAAPRRARREADDTRRRRPARRAAHRPSTSSAAAAPSRSIGVYGGMTDPLPMMTLFDKQIQLRMGQANVRRWVDDILPFVGDDDPLGVDTFATHRLPLDRGARRLRDVPDQAGRRGQGALPALSDARVQPDDPRGQIRVGCDPGLAG